MEMQQRRDPPGTVSRRGLLKGAAVLAAAWPAPAPAQQSGPILAYVGTYNPNGEGIYLYQMDPATGILTPKNVFPNPNPSSLALHPNGKYLYAVNEISNFKDTKTGSVTAFAIDRPTGNLTMLNAVSSGGAGPAHVSVDPSGKYVFAANYGGGNVGVVPIRSDGSLGDPTDVQAGTGSVGPKKAVYAWPGSFAISGHEAPHAHMAQTDPAGKYLLATDLGLDQLMIWKLDMANGKLIATDPPFVATLPGAGPRHFAFHPNGQWVYLINEEDSTLTFLSYDAANGRLRPVHTIPTLPSNFAGTNFTSEVMVSPDGRFVYGANRLYNAIAIFAIDPATGEPALIGNEWTRGDYPRNFNIDPTGNFMYVCHNRNDVITSFSINHETGQLTFTGQFIGVGMPSIIVFLS